MREGETNMKIMNWKQALCILGVCILGATIPVLGACAKSGNDGSIQVYVTDAPPVGVTAVLITAGKVEAHKSGDSDDKWVTLLTNPPVFDLVKSSGVNYLLGTSDLAAGNYTQVRLEITDCTVTIAGEQVKATVPSGELKLVGNITIEAGKRTSVILDFDGEKSVVLEGQGKVTLKPVVQLTVSAPVAESTIAVATTAVTTNSAS